MRLYRIGDRVINLDNICYVEKVEHAQTENGRITINFGAGPDIHLNDNPEAEKLYSWFIHRASNFRNEQEIEKHDEE